MCALPCHSTVPRGSLCSLRELSPLMLVLLSLKSEGIAAPCADRGTAGGHGRQEPAQPQQPGHGAAQGLLPPGAQPVCSCSRDPTARALNLTALWMMCVHAKEWRCYAGA